MRHEIPKERHAAVPDAGSCLALAKARCRSETIRVQFIGFTPSTKHLLVTNLHSTRRSSSNGTIFLVQV